MKRPVIPQKKAAEAFTALSDWENKVRENERQEWLQDQKAQQEYKEWCLKEDLRSAGLSVKEVLKVTEQFFKEQK